MQRLTPILATFSLAVACTVPDPRRAPRPPRRPPRRPPATGSTANTDTTATTSGTTGEPKAGRSDPCVGDDDGIVYPSACNARELGVSLDATAACPLPADRFACGWRLCLIASEYCEQHAYPGVYKHAFLCKPLPDACEPEPTCACLQGERCGTSCATSPEGGLKLDCDGDGGESG